MFDPDFEVITVREQGWESYKDRDLLQAAQSEFDALVTMDRGIPHQQNVRALALGVVVVGAVTNRRDDVAPLIARVNLVLRGIQPGEVVYVAAP